MVDEKNVPGGYKLTDIGVIPEDWELVPIGDIFKFKNGLNKAKQFFGEGTPIINYMDIYKSRGIRFKDIRGKVTLSSNELANYNVQKGDVFFTRTSETPDEIGITSVLLDEPQNTTFSGFILRARPVVDVLDIDYKKYCFSADIVRKEIISKCTYTTRALTNGRVLSKVNIFVPPKPEQKAIAESLSDTDNLILSLEKLIDKKKKIKQGAIQELLTGKKRLPGFSGEWEVKKLGEVVRIQGGWAFKSDFLKERGIPIIRISNISNNIIDMNEIVYYKEGKITEDFKVFKNDILIAMSGATTGKIGIYMSEIVSYLNQRVGKFVIKSENELSNHYLLQVIQMNGFKNQLDKYIAQGAQPNISGKQIESIDVLIPNDMNEQIAIAQILSDMDSEIKALEEKLEKYKTIKQGMMQELLTGRIRLI